ncbi:MAG: hypothetical protein M3537_07150, partial [Chloroflexota bacterium]|nr:hypothetical protein [Chloroflexota bacterium]
MEALEYDEFDLLLEPSGDGFSARVISSPTGPTKPVPFVPPRAAEGLKKLVLTLNAVRGVHALETAAAPDAKQFGKDLFNALFHDDALNAFRGSLHVSGLEGRGLRLRLRFADSQSLANIPWELLYDP